MRLIDYKYPFIDSIRGGALYEVYDLIKAINIYDIHDISSIEFQVFSSTFRAATYRHMHELFKISPVLNECSGCILEPGGRAVIYNIDPESKIICKLILLFPTPVHLLDAFKFKSYVAVSASLDGVSPKDLVRLSKDLSTVNMHWDIRIFSDALDIPTRELSEEMGRMFLEIYLLNIFKQYSEIEHNIIEGSPNGKKTIIDDTKFLSNLKSSINYYNNTWFTEISRITGFKVREHLRLQPYGPGRSKLKLIVIDSFLKKGYHRRAEKVIVNKNN